MPSLCLAIPYSLTYGQREAQASNLVFYQCHERVFVVLLTEGAIYCISDSDLI